ncbi:MAG: hypothetical protein ACR2L6_04600 [Gemmatimonadaceae bacterium]
MLARILPERIDNDYRGHKLALWFLGLVLLVRIAIALGSIFNGYGAASGPDGIPLASFPPAASQTIVSLFALIGISRLMLAAFAVLALIRYRALVPLMFLLLLLEQAGRQVALYYLPVPRVGEPPVSVINIVPLGLMIVGFVLSLMNRAGPDPLTKASGTPG